MPEKITLTHDGRTLDFHGWAAVTGIAWATIRARYHAGWSVARILSQPVARSRRGGGRPSHSAIRPVPRLRRHRATGRAFVRWKLAGKDHTRYLGAWGTVETARAYRQFAAAWLSGDRGAADPDGLGVGELVIRWLEWCRTEYRKFGKPTGEVRHCARVGGIVNEMFGTMLAAEFGPAQLRAFRAAVMNRMLRTTANSYTRRVVRMFRWGVEHEFIPAGVAGSLLAVRSLAPGRGGREGTPRQPAPNAAVEATVAKLVERGEWWYAGAVTIQRLTGMRPAEVLAMRPADLDTSGPLWLYSVPPWANKNEHKGKAQWYYLGPKAQEVIRPRLADCPADRPVFADAGDVSNYGRAVRRACLLAGVEPWTPHQLRHALATEVAEKLQDAGAAAAALGDTLDVARRVYVHVDPADAMRRKIAETMG
jgi:integrase